jgi:hypothetical protein
MADSREHPDGPLRRHNPQALLGPNGQHTVADVSKLRSTMRMPHGFSRLVPVSKHECGLWDRVWINAGHGWRFYPNYCQNPASLRSRLLIDCLLALSISHGLGGAINCEFALVGGGE